MTAPFTVRLVRNSPGLLTSQMNRTLDQLLGEVTSAAKDAAKKAQAVSRSKATYVGRPISPSRPGRRSTGGKFAQNIKWANTGGQVRLDTDLLDRKSPYWKIQEIGTGERAQVRRGDGGPANGGQARLGRGRPTKGDQRIVSVRSQRGRVIKAGLVWANSGRYYPAMPGRFRQDAIVPVSTTNYAPYRFPPRVVIGREIEGKNFIKQGAEQGFLQYRTSVLAAARRAFPGRKR